MSLIIAVDGPAAAGKGTLARRLALAFGLPHLDTGLLYRAVGRLVLDAGGDPASTADAARAVSVLVPETVQRGDLRVPEVDRAASLVAADPAVRAALLDFQRDFAAREGAVLDGRDIGTVVCPDAPVKLFVTASAEARLQRRLLELRNRGVAVEEQALRAEMQARDERDAARDIAPLRPAEDAEVLDTTHLDADQAFQRAEQIVLRKWPR
ncbi:Cytidylate kinase [Granulibacter bethesdensis]|uniref:Cytidylate kinase n=1 Tax=Granulibacter bethesdensis TaxID=364410 RepID=A0AAC9P9R2_9PROT|nr:(d)CMP kinase [Granulibacter bethesdensis]APH55339.1 Cytidylate kinase [Granulibacter bethesdensis]APH62926.1 Cytidylate kinase [Granulibacter bethesdensis]